MAVLHITKDNFAQEVMASDKPVLVDFYADWCGPCQMMTPVMERIAEKRPDVKVCKVNVDEQRTLASAFQVSSIPMLVVIQNGKLVHKAVGAQPEESVLAMLP